jgi:hypothetical protein
VRRVALSILLVAAGAAAALALASSPGQHGHVGFAARWPRSAFPLPPARLVSPPRHVRYVSPRGSDAWPGTARRPWRTLGKAATDAKPGETVDLLPGVYGMRNQRTEWTASGTPDAPITFQGMPGRPRPTILGYNKVDGSHLRLTGLSFEGPTGHVDPRTQADPGGEEVLVWLAGQDVALSSCEVSGARWHAGVYIAGGGNVRLIGNYVHDNGDVSRPDQANLDHGIYWAQGVGGLIADNLIVHNLAMGIQLYPSASHVVVEQNTIVGNGKAGVIVAQDSSHNLIVNNIVAENADAGIRSYRLVGADNVVVNNVIWNNGSGSPTSDTGGLTLTRNFSADPRFTGKADYRLLPGSPALGRALRMPQTVGYDITGLSRQAPNVGAY